MHDGYIELSSEKLLSSQVTEDVLVGQIVSYAKDMEEHWTTKNLNWFQWIWYKHKVRKEVQRLLKGGKF